MSRACLPFPLFPVTLKDDSLSFNPRNGRDGRRIHGFTQETT